MLLYEDKILLLPAKCGSRSIVAGIEGKHFGHRHEPLHNLTLDEICARNVYMIIRDPYSWYESFYNHRIWKMKLQESEWWGHKFKQTKFEDALFDYCYGAERQEVVEKGGILNGAQFGGEFFKDIPNHMLYQNLWGVGYYSQTMMWTCCKELKEKYQWNTDIKFIMMGDFEALSNEGFVVTNRVKIGSGKYKPNEWSDVMRHWVKQKDAAFWDYVQSNLVSSSN